LSKLLQEAAQLRARANELEKQHVAEVQKQRAAEEKRKKIEAVVNVGSTVYFHGKDPRLVVELFDGSIVMIDTETARSVQTYKRIGELHDELCRSYSMYTLERAMTATEIKARKYPSFAEPFIFGRPGTYL
jgi:hypothetical protein